ncbi:MAG: branched-chain amino acid ABC transporter permease [Anaerolineae bacterium]|nr:branched-chain amino acid ABC transporter permease [Anaerolineae bacterium]
MDRSEAQSRPKRYIDFGRWIRLGIGVIVVGFLLFRLWNVLWIERAYGLDTWTRFAVSGIILGSVYAVVALGYTLVYGILFMINFAHGDVMMLGAFAGYFTLEALKSIGFLNRSVGTSVLSVIIAFSVGMLFSMLIAVLLERIAYRPLRTAPRLVPLISAIGSSLFLQNMAQLAFGAERHTYANPDMIQRNSGWMVMIQGKEVLITYTGVLTLVISFLLMVGLFLLVQKTKMGKAMRAVAQDKETAALMGIDVDQVISNTFAISGLLAGAAGVMWGLHMGILYHYVGFIPGMKAFTAAVLGGIGNIPGAMLGGLTLGILEAVGPAILGIPFQLKDVLAFSILVLVLIFRPTGILGEVLSKERA